MAYCSICGTELDENGICPKCAAEADEKEGTDARNRILEKFQDTPDETADYDTEDIEQNRIFAVLAYLGIFLLVPIICAPNSKFARFHASQAIDLILGTALYTVLAAIITWLCFRVGTALGIIFLGIFLIGSLALFLLWIIGISNAAKGLAKELPYLGSFRLLK